MSTTQQSNDDTIHSTTNDIYYMYQVVHNSHIVLECIEYNDIESIEKEWNSKGLGVVVISSNNDVYD